ncbi:ATP-citrate synthase alpha chain protein 1 isoform X3 [Brassica napus]|uniref:ATP-citrate synthase alpha chain protein 1 isoform X3 n=1 Tax=Brassica napus TaxID=3708 RepID=UPI002078E3EE|nr:ATP-citrate synthase alpha chain protein 1 isoform X3 [Brassica napus]
MFLSLYMCYLCLQLHVCMHSLNAVFLLGDTCLNSLRFPLFRISYFAFWSCIFVAYQWIIHAFMNLRWPYQFLDLSSPYAPLWDAYTVLRGLRFDHKAEELFARASQLVIGLGSLFYLLRHMRTPWPNSNTKSEKFIPEDRVSPRKMARKKIREYDSKRLVKEHFKRLSGNELPIRSVQINQTTDLNELVEKEPWLSSEKLVVKPDMLFGKRGKSGLVALKLDFAEVATFVKERLGKEVEMSGCIGPITTFIVEPFVPHNEEFYLNVVSDRLGCSISFSECGGIEIEENWDKVKTIFIQTGASLTPEVGAPLVATLPLEIKAEIEEFIKVIFTLFQDLDFTFLEMNPFTLVDGKPYPLDMRGELDDTAAFKNFKKWGDTEFPMPFGRVMSPTESFIHGLDEKTSASLKFTVLNPKGRIWTMVAGGGASVIYADTVGDLGYASELGNYAEYSGAPKEDEVLQYARVVIDCATANPDGKSRVLVIGGGIANFTDVAATFNGIIRALKEKEAKLKAARMHIYVRRGGPNYQKGLAKMRSLGGEIGVPIEVYGPEATMTGICKEAIQYITAAA